MRGEGIGFGSRVIIFQEKLFERNLKVSGLYDNNDNVIAIRKLHNSPNYKYYSSTWYVSVYLLLIYFTTLRTPRFIGSTV